MLLPKPSCVCIPYIKCVTPRVCLVPFLAFFGTDIKTKMGIFIYMYLKHSQDYVNFKYMWVSGSNSLGSSVFAFFALCKERRRDPAHVTPRVRFYMHTKI